MMVCGMWGMTSVLMIDPDIETGAVSYTHLDVYKRQAYAVANVLLGKRVSKVIGVEPLLVTAANLEEAWFVMTKEKAPQSIVNSLTETRKKEKMRIEKNSKWKTK